MHCCLPHIVLTDWLNVDQEAEEIISGCHHAMYQTSWSVSAGCLTVASKTVQNILHNFKIGLTAGLGLAIAAEYMRT